MGFLFYLNIHVFLNMLFVSVHRTVVNCVGDMETGQLVQEISNLVDILPQLKVTFNLQAEIDLAMQPLRNENSQLRR